MKIQAAGLLALIAGGMFFGVGCEDQQAALPNGNAVIENAEKPAQQLDKQGDEIVAGQGKTEAREWLKDAAHTFFKENRKQIAQFVEDFYSAGASTVYIANSEKHGETVFGGILLIVLPKDAAARGKVFAVDKNVAPVFDEDPAKDEGQKYLIHDFD